MRVVLDTNTLVSALLFPGVCSKLVPLWQNGRIVPLISKDVLHEYLRVLAYPKFRLEEVEIRALIEEELLPYSKTVRVTRRVSVVKRDPDDDKFLECAVCGHASYLISGDLDLRALGSYESVRIVSAADFLKTLGPR